MDGSFFALTLAIAYAVIKLWKIGQREHGIPPGPRTAPVFGNALQFPKAFPHLKFTEWARVYGDIYSVKILNRTIIVVSSPEAVNHLLDKAGSVTGNRLKSYLVQEVSGGFFMALEDMDTNVWRHARKAIHASLTTEALARYLPMQQVEYLQLMNDILNTPHDVFDHIKRTTASVMMRLVYGKRCPRFRNSDAEVFFEGIKLFNEVADPGAHPPVDLFPPLKYVPSRWAPWKSLCSRAKALRDDLYSRLLSECKQALDSGCGTGCFMEDVLKNQEKLGMSLNEVKGLGAILMDAGAETTASFLQSFVLALLNYPECQLRAQEEVDRVIGTDRLPLLDDYDRLPFLRALVLEALRFRPLFPIGIPHVNTEDITYKQYQIPKESIIFMNIHGIFHDPDLFDEPESFNPDRYLKSQFGTKAGADTSSLCRNLAFGAGRRICPGENMAWRTITLNAMNLLWAFNFAKDTSGTGGMDKDAYAKPGIELAPCPFTCDVKARGEGRAEIIRESFAAMS